ncbi:MAG TPA: hypothetical protein VGP07_24880 [Polyangia bacterium]
MSRLALDSGASPAPSGALFEYVSQVTAAPLNTAVQVRPSPVIDPRHGSRAPASNKAVDARGDDQPASTHTSVDQFAAEQASNGQTRNTQAPGGLVDTDQQRRDIAKDISPNFLTNRA